MSRAAELASDGLPPSHWPRRVTRQAWRAAATLEQTVKLITHAGGSAKYVVADVHDADAVRHAVEVAGGDAGRLDVAVNSAGVDGGNDSHPLIDYPVETLDLMLATNVRGMFLSMKYELEIMAMLMDPLVQLCAQ
ncbi:SDR family oxidoreductase [Jatrophihabitans sp. DSM 45814]